MIKRSRRRTCQAWVESSFSLSGGIGLEARSSTRSMAVERLGIVFALRLALHGVGPSYGSRPPVNDQLRTGTIQGNPTV